MALSVSNQNSLFGSWNNAQTPAETAGSIAYTAPVSPSSLFNFVSVDSASSAASAETAGSIASTTSTSGGFSAVA